MITYEIRIGIYDPCELWSITETCFGGNAENFICSGTYTYCDGIKAKMEAMK